MMAKVLPGVLFIAIVAPALIITLIASVDPAAASNALGAAGYYHVTSILVMIFSTIVAPELICPDRRDKVLHLYLVRPITPLDYIASRWAAFFSVTLFFVYIGQIILFGGMLLASGDQWLFLKDNWLDVPRFLLAGLAIAIFLTTLPMAVAAFTVRRAYAAAFIIGIFIVGASASGILTSCREEHPSQGFHGSRPVGQCVPITGESGKWFALLDVARTPIHINDMVFNEKNESLTSRYVEQLPDYAPIGWYLLLVLLPGYLLVRRYQRISL